MQSQTLCKVFSWNMVLHLMMIRMVLEMADLVVQTKNKTNEDLKFIFKKLLEKNLISHQEYLDCLKHLKYGA